MLRPLRFRTAGRGSVHHSAKTPASGKPWVYRAGFVDCDAVVDLDLLAKGFHIVVGPVPYNGDGPVLQHWNAVYKHLVEHGFSNKPALEGAGHAAGEIFGWAIENPDKVSCIYAENPVLRGHMTKKPLLENMDVLARAGVPLLHTCGNLDPAFKEQTQVIERRYKELGGKITVIVQESAGQFLPAARERGTPSGSVGVMSRSSPSRMRSKASKSWRRPA
jgi:hypothetical protein